MVDDQYVETDKGHGRIETRGCVVSSQMMLKTSASRAYEKRQAGGMPLYAPFRSKFFDGTALQVIMRGY
jgi:hypothetical protein